MPPGMPCTMRCRPVGSWPGDLLPRRPANPPASGVERSSISQLRPSFPVRQRTTKGRPHWYFRTVRCIREGRRDVGWTVCRGPEDAARGRVAVEAPGECVLATVGGRTRPATKASRQLARGTCERSAMKRPLMLLVAAAFSVALAPPAAAAGPAAGYRPWEAGASNMGMCSAYLGQLPGHVGPNARSDVNHLIKALGPVLGLSSPGDLYRVRAKQHVNEAPELECLRRSQ